MRSDILAQELRERRDKKRLERKRRQNAKNQRAWYKRQKAKQAIINTPLHPTLSREETLAVEEAAKIDGVLRPSPQSVIQPAVVPTDVIRPEARPAPDCVAAMLEHDRRLAPHLEELKILKYGQPQQEQKISVPAPFDLPNGI